MRARWLLSFVLVLVGMVGAACSSDDNASNSSTSSSSSSSSRPESERTSLSPGDVYVGLGSSIASGFGIPEQSPPCGRSSRNYAQLIAARYELELTDVSCGASLTANIVDTPQLGNPPQIDAVPPDADLVTVAIGGNDLNYNGTALVCSNPATVCTRDPDYETKLAALPGALEGVIDAVRTKAPKATVVLVFNPREFPDENCAALSLDDSELAIVRGIGEDLEATFQDVAERTGVAHIDLYAEPGDHTGCAPENERWAAGAKPSDTFAFHPTALGHEVMADKIAALLGD